MSWLDPFFSGIKAIVDAVGNVLPFQPAVQFTGDGVSLSNDTSNGRTVVTIPGSEGPTEVPWSSAITADTQLPNAAEQAVPVSTNSGPVTVTVPASPDDGDILIIKWTGGSDPATVARVVSGTEVEDPNSPGSFFDSSFVLPYVGAAYRWRANAGAFWLESTATKVNLATGVTGVLPPGSGGSGWATVLDVDFSALPNQTIGGDGAVTIGGLTFTKGNSANEAAAMAIVSGSGLVIQPANSTDYNNTVRTMPYLWLPLGQIPGLSAVEYSSGIRVAAYVSADNIAGSYDNSVIGIDANDTNVSTLLKRGIQASHNPGFTVQNDFAGATSGIETDVTLASGTRVCELELDAILPTVTTARYGAYAAGWPNRQTGLSQVGATSDGTRKDATAAAIQPSFKLAPASILTGMGVVVGAHCANSGTALSITIARIRVDVRF